MNIKLVYKEGSGEQDCSDMHEFKGIRKVYILHLITGGCGYFTVREKTYRIKKGQMFLIFPNQPVHYYPDKINPYKYKWVDFSGSLCKELINQTALSVDNAVIDNMEESEALLDEIASCPIHYRCDPLILELMAMLIKKFPSTEALDDMNDCLFTAKNYIASNLHKSDLQVAKCAEYVNLSRSQFYRMFLSQTGLSPKEYIDSQRMDFAKQLLSDKSLPIGYIACSCGYDDPLYFSKTFKKNVGISPTQFRKLHNENEKITDFTTHYS